MILLAPNKQDYLQIESQEKRYESFYYNVIVEQVLGRDYIRKVIFEIYRKTFQNIKLNIPNDEIRQLFLFIEQSDYPGFKSLLLGIFNLENEAPYIIDTNTHIKKTDVHPKKEIYINMRTIKQILGKNPEKQLKRLKEILFFGVESTKEYENAYTIEKQQELFNTLKTDVFSRHFTKIYKTDPILVEMVSSLEIYSKNNIISLLNNLLIRMLKNRGEEINSLNDLKDSTFPIFEFTKKNNNIEITNTSYFYSVPHLLYRGRNIEATDYFSLWGSTKFEGIKNYLKIVLHVDIEKCYEEQRMKSLIANKNIQVVKSSNIQEHLSKPIFIEYISKKLGIPKDEDIFYNAFFDHFYSDTIAHATINRLIEQDSIKVTYKNGICELKWHDILEHVSQNEPKKINIHITGLKKILTEYFNWPEHYANAVFDKEIYYTNEEVVIDYLKDIFSTNKNTSFNNTNELYEEIMKFQHLPWNKEVAHHVPFITQKITLKEICRYWSQYDFIDGWKQLLSQVFDVNRTNYNLFSNYGIQSIVSEHHNSPRLLRHLIKEMHPDIQEEKLDTIIDEVSKIVFTSSMSIDHIERSEKNDTFYINREGNIQAEIDNNTTQKKYVSISLIPHKTTKVHIKSAYWSETIETYHKSQYKIKFPLQPNSINTIYIYGTDTNENINTKVQKFSIEQLSNENQDLENLVKILSKESKSIEEQKENKEVIKKLEKDLLIYFTKNFKNGVSIFENLIKSNKLSLELSNILKKTLIKFEKINTLFPDSIFTTIKPYFYQKWCAYYIVEAYDSGLNSHIITTDAGGGKTVISLLFLWYVHQKTPCSATVICPNQIKDRWDEDSSLFTEEITKTVLYGSSSKVKREKLLEHSIQDELSIIIANKEFLRHDEQKDGEKNENIALIKQAHIHNTTNRKNIILVDEARSFLNNSLQTSGVEKLKSNNDFLLFLDAYPFNKFEEIRIFLQKIDPSNPLYQNQEIFEKHFSPKKYTSKERLQKVMSEYSSGVVLDNVFPSYAQNVSIKKQRGCLPTRKRENNIYYNLDYEQCFILQSMFEGTDTWEKMFEKVHKKNPSKRYLAKKSYMRQFLFNPSFLGLPIKSPKVVSVVDYVRNQILDKTDDKIIIFAFFKEEINQYVKELHACRFDGSTTRSGYVKKHQKIQYFRTDNKKRFIIDKDTRKLIPCSKLHGSPIEEGYYNYLQFQHDPNQRVMVASNKLARGVNFTAAKYSIMTHLPDTVVEESQILGRNRRLEKLDYNKHRFVQNINFISTYPKEYLNELDQYTLDTYFSMGTFDQVQKKVLVKLKVFLDQFKSDFISDNEMERMSKKHLLNLMPFLK